ncbi:Predicted arabinose efflux permease, MFS family [Sphingomonas guangdongensis]|uniref:Predicted arabinose efflux permease, MFS family n=1 Tax=Sphingomonas guangdongensis TaxID=1141890 RepID=A0A285QBQ1_9SPHN|nr:MFS transporter [Sphingomonas guangdongensis]SOB78938.1 Predicted arabinose efflux permease, MFS family [Sphingomonas guangdongensis]
MDASPAQAASNRRYANLVLAMLLVVYTFNFLDRQILGILVQPIKADLGLTDTQLGALGGIAFALLYSTLAIPLALVADRTSRSWVITISLAVWSGFTALCGVATSFWQLFAFRLGVGVGEAGGVAPSYAMIADYFPPERRARALAIYSLGIPVGLALGALLGGFIAASVDWRTAFLVVGVAGIVLAPIFRLLVREPARGGADRVSSATTERAPLAAVFPILARKPSFWLMAFAAAFSSMCGYGLAFWTPSMLIRSYGFSLWEASQFMGGLLLIGGTLGVFAGGWFADRLGTRDRGVYAKLPATAWAITVPLFALGFWSSSPWSAFAFLLIPNGLNILWLGPVTTAVQNLVPAHMRATASASFLFINNLIGLGIGSWVMGAMSDAMTLRFGAEALRYSMMAALSFYVVASGLMYLAVKPLRKDWVEA